MDIVTILNYTYAESLEMSIILNEDKIVKMLFKKNQAQVHEKVNVAQQSEFNPKIN